MKRTASAAMAARAAKVSSRVQHRLILQRSDQQRLDDLTSGGRRRTRQTPHQGVSRGERRLEAAVEARIGFYPKAAVAAGAEAGTPVDLPAAALGQRNGQSGEERRLGLGPAQQGEDEGLQQQMSADESGCRVAGQAQDQPPIAEAGVPAGFARLHGDTLKERLGAERLDQ